MFVKIKRETGDRHTTIACEQKKRRVRTELGYNFSPPSGLLDESTGTILKESIVLLSKCRIVQLEDGNIQAVEHPKKRPILELIIPFTSRSSTGMLLVMGDPFY